MPYLLLRPEEVRSRDKVVAYRDHAGCRSRRLGSQVRRLIASTDVTSNNAMVAYNNRHSCNDYQFSISQSYGQRPVSYSSYAYPTAYPTYDNHAVYQPYKYYEYPMMSIDYYPQCPTCGKQFLRVSRRDDHRYRHGH